MSRPRRPVRGRRGAGRGLCHGALRRRAVGQFAQRPVRESRAGCGAAAVGQVFRHIHDLSLRFHLERRTGSLTKVVERGTKSIDMMLYFLLFNIAPTVIELVAICSIFLVKFGAGLVAATLAMVAVYITFTRKVTDWRTHVQRADERRRQQGDRPRRRFAAQLRNGQIFRRRGARGQALRRSHRRLYPRRRPQRSDARLAQHRPGADHQR